MKLCIEGIGAWGPGFGDWPSLREFLIQDGAAELPPAASPKPALIPAREQRRAPLLVRLGVEVAAQACADAGVEPADVLSVFASGMADMGITDYMCRTLAAGHRQLSPTKFHNSVHNAASGYWSISTGCHAAANSVAAFRETIPAALLEAAALCVAEREPVLLVAFDVPGPKPVDLTDIAAPFGAALLLRPGQGARGLNLDVTAGAGAWPTLRSARLNALYETNPSARMLALLEALAGASTEALALPLGRAVALSLTAQAAEQAA
ncbi:MAG: beta-ketoacyl synthase chain length factor [Pseudomonadota bacterium]